MYVRCRKCSWDSGDFGYNTFGYKFKSSFENIIMSSTRRPNDMWFKNKMFGKYWLKPQLNMFFKQIIYGVKFFFEHKRGLRPKTYEEFKSSGGKCPK